MDRLTAEDFELFERHAPARALALYVIGALSENEASEIEAHVVACDACSDALAREARIERALELVAEDLVPEPVALPVRRANFGAAARTAKGRWGGVVGAVAIAASALLWLGPGQPPGAGASRLDAPDSSFDHDRDGDRRVIRGDSQPDVQAQILFVRDLDGG